MNEEKKEMPVFVRIDDYKDVTDIMNLAREKLEQAKAILAKIEHITSEENAELESWGSDLADVEHRIEEIEHRIAKLE